MDFGNFGRQAARQGVLGCSRGPIEILLEPSTRQLFAPKKTLFRKTSNKATELKALSHYYDAFTDMKLDPAGGASATRGCVPFHAPGGPCGIASIGPFDFSCIIKLYH